MEHHRHGRMVFIFLFNTKPSFQWEKTDNLWNNPNLYLIIRTWRFSITSGTSQRWQSECFCIISFTGIWNFNHQKSPGYPSFLHISHHGKTSRETNIKSPVSFPLFKSCDTWPPVWFPGIPFGSTIVCRV